MDTSKLSKKVQEYIKKIERERETSVEALNEFINNQEPSSFYIVELISTGEEQGPSFKHRYIQTHTMEVSHEGVHLRIILRDNHIDLQWGDDKEHHEEIAFIPSSYQSARLVSKNNMR